MYAYFGVQRFSRIRHIDFHYEMHFGKWKMIIITIYLAAVIITAICILNFGSRKNIKENAKA